jgi:hypothetical protein
MNTILMMLSSIQLSQTLLDNGYNVEFSSSSFVGYTGGEQSKARYEIKFRNDEGELDTGSIYVWVEGGTIRADF